MLPFKRLLRDLDASLEQEELRSRLQFLWLFRILAGVSLAMTLVNILTDRQLLGWSTFLFALLCVADALLTCRGTRGRHIAAVLFVPQFLTLLTFFLVSGTPEGFSALWICMLPTFGLTLYGRRRGTVLSAVMLGIVLFFLDTPWGVRLLGYPYTASFRLRFPLLYLAFFCVALFLETVRVLTQKKLEKVQQQYRYLYAHDALTGLYNRYGFNEQLQRAFSAPHPDGMALLIVDIDHFKEVNDRCGHAAGDLVLREVAARLSACAAGRGETSRWGGEEFAVLLPCWQDAEALGAQICSAVRARPVCVENQCVPVTVSVGVYAVQDVQGLSVEQLVRQADLCLYRAKAAGRDCPQAVVVQRAG